MAVFGSNNYSSVGATSVAPVPGTPGDRGPGSRAATRCRPW